MGKTLCKDIRTEFVEMRYFGRPESMSRINMGLSKTNMLEGNTWKETQPVCFHPKDIVWNVYLKVECS